MNKKRLLAIIMTVMLIVGLLPLSTFAEGDVTNEAAPDANEAGGEMKKQKSDDKSPAVVYRPPMGKNDLVYDKTEHTLILPGQALGGTMMYSLTENGDYSTELPKGRDSGTYLIWYYVAGNGDHEDSPKDYVEAQIRGRRLHVHVDNKSKLVGEQDPEFTYTVTGLLEGDTLGDFEIKRLPNDDIMEAPGIYTLRPEFTVPENYEKVITGGNFFIYESAPVTPDKISFHGTVRFVDGNQRPFGPEDNPVKVRPVLYRESSAYSEQKVEAEPNWDYFSFTYDELDAFDDKNNEWKYRVSAASIEGYRTPECLSTSNHSATITYYPDESPVSMSGTKNWIDGGKYHDNAKEVWLELWRKSGKGGTTPENISAYPTLITPSWEGNKWSFTDLPSRDSEGYPYSYYLIDKYRPEFVPYLGYKVSEYTNLDWSVTDRALDGCVITSRLVSSKTQIGGTIVWDDDVGDHNNAEEIKLVLKRVSEDPNAGGEETVDAAPVWDGDTYTFDDLDVYDSEGNGYTYWVIEEKVDGYEEPEYINAGNHAAVTDRACDGATITNSKEKKPATVTSKPDAKALTANGSAQQLVTAGTAEGGEMQYALGTDAATEPASGWSTAIPKGTEAGDYFVWYKAVGDRWHTDSEAACVKVNIHGHKYGPWTKLDANQHQRVCAYDSTHVEKEDHKWDKGKAQTQGGKSVTVYTCTVCKATKEENTSPGKSYISYDLNGGMLNGKTGKVVIEGTNGTTIILPEPTREGYIFDYWEGSRYNAGDEYVINGDHTLTAHWKKGSAAPREDEEDEGSSGEGGEGNAPEDTTPKPGEGENNGDSNQGGTPGDDKGDTNKSEANKNNRNNDAPPTGDENSSILWLTLSIVMLMGCVLIAREARK